MANQLWLPESSHSKGLIIVEENLHYKPQKLWRKHCDLKKRVTFLSVYYSYSETMIYTPYESHSGRFSVLLILYSVTFTFFTAYNNIHYCTPQIILPLCCEISPFWKHGYFSVTNWGQSHSVMSDSLRLHGLYSPWNSPGQNMGILSQWVAFPFSRGSSQPRDWTQVFCIAGGFFTSWAIWLD